MRYLIIIFLILLAIPLIKRFIQDFDYRRQLSGKKAERKLDDQSRIPTELLSESDQAQIHACDGTLDKAKADAKVNSISNVAGPH